MAKRLAFLIIYFLSPILPLLAVYRFSPESFSDSQMAVAHVCSSMAFTWLTLQFALSARPRFIEKHFGMDKIYRLHSLMPVAAVALIAVHKLLMEALQMVGSTGPTGTVAFFTFAGVVTLGLLFLIDSILTRLAPVKKLRSPLLRFTLFKRETQLIIHNLTVVAYIAMLLHAVGSTAAQGSPTVRLILSAYWTLGACFYIYHKIVKMILLRASRFVVESVVQESPNMWTLALKPTRGRIRPYQPGQFGWLRIVDGDVRREAHPFSFSSTPTNVATLEVTIKELGDFTNTVKRIKAGDHAEVDYPYGVFSYLNYPLEQGIVLIVGGVGITPALSFIRYASVADKARDITLIWGANTPADLIRMNELEAASRAMPKLRIVPVLFRDDSWAGEKGVVDLEKIQRIATSTGNKLGSLGFYVCGPGPMVDGVLKSLRQLGIEGKRVHFERFAI